MRGIGAGLLSGRCHAAGVVGWAAEADVEVVGVAGGVLDEGGATADGVLDRLGELGLGDAERAGGAAELRVELPGEEDVLRAAAGGEGVKVKMSERSCRAASAKTSSQICSRSRPAPKRAQTSKGGLRNVSGFS